MDKLTSTLKMTFNSISRIKLPKWFIFLFISVVLGLVWYLVLYGRFSLFFSHVSWIYATGRDPLQHQLGWEFFRIEPWRFPLGKIQSYGFPQGTTVTFMDSIPLYAFIFKLLSPLLDKNFQYFGLWELNSFIGQIFVGLLIIREFTSSKLKMILGSSLLVLSPPMIYRAFFHSSLSAHWLILLAILFVILEYRQKMKIGWWIILFSTAMLIHLYYIPMILPIWAVSLVFRFKREGKKSLFLFEAIKIIGVIILIGYCTGIFGLSLSNLSELGFGEYSWNLNGFINSFGYSNFLEPLNHVYTQEEGFSYLGVGNFIILLIALVCFFIKDPARRKWKVFLPFILISMIYVVYSLSNVAAFGKFIFWNINLDTTLLKIVELFRSSGRFIWPLFYFIVLFGIVVLVRNIRFSIAILIIALIFQYYDLQPLFKSKQLTGFSEYSPKMDDSFWKQAGVADSRIIVIPIDYYENLALFAVHHQMSLNAGYFGRDDDAVLEQYAQEIWQQLLEGKSDDKTIYVLSENKYLEIAKQKIADKMYICTIDNFDVIFSSDNALVQKNVIMNQQCSIPGL